MNKVFAVSSIYTFSYTVLIVYLLFNVLWGLNYNREGIAKQLHLQVPENYSTVELNSLTYDLVKKVNANRRLLDKTIQYPNNQTLFNEAILSYQNIERSYDFIHYSIPSIKIPLYNRLGSYLGYNGYYNPFTGEANVNTILPRFLIPYVSCHEMAHQLGYATEDEANFTGFLAASSSNDPLFKYSTYLDLYRYANFELYFRDSSLALKHYQALDTLVKLDLKELRIYLKAHENPIERVTTRMYGWFLKANQQPQGIDTYSKVIAWLLGYKRKYSTI